MHSIATNLCVWFRTLVDETTQEFHRKLQTLKPSSSSPQHLFPIDMPYDNAWHYNGSDTGGPVVAQALHQAPPPPPLHHSTQCADDSVLNGIAREAAPYLYPFTIEYSLIAAAVWYIIWSHIGRRAAGQESRRAHHYDDDAPHDDPLLAAASIKARRYIIHVDCRSTNRGLFPGILVLVGTVVAIIIFFVTISVDEYRATGVFITHVVELLLLVVSSVACVLAFSRTLRLDISAEAQRERTLDDFLLFVALPCFFIVALFSIIAGIAALNWLSIVVNSVSLVQVVLQTTFVYDGLRRCARSPHLQAAKPGRNLITFLVVCNIAMWMFATFKIKRMEAAPSQMSFYGAFEWSLISHLSVPLTIFYRFHSSVCLVDIWRHAYQPVEVH